MERTNFYTIFSDLHRYAGTYTQVHKYTQNLRGKIVRTGFSVNAERKSNVGGLPGDYSSEDRATTEVLISRISPHLTPGESFSFHLTSAWHTVPDSINIC